MADGFIGRVTSAGALKNALDVGSQRVRGIADRVAKASLGNQDGFALPINGQARPDGTLNGVAPAEQSAVDLEAEMTDLADSQLRFEATSKLLSKAYAQVRDSLRDR